MDIKLSITTTALSVLLFSSCGGDKTSENQVNDLIDHSAHVEMPNYELLKDAKDTVSYCLGLQAGIDLKANYAGVDLEILEKSFNAVINGDETDFSETVAEEMVTKYQQKSVRQVTDSISYALGINLGTTINDKFPPLSVDVFIEAVKDEMESRPFIIAPKEATQLITKVNSQAFLEENAKKEGVITLPSGLQYKVLRKGTGSKPAPGSTVTVHYKGTLIDGTVFDSSYDRGQPATFPLTNVIRGWQEGIPLMSEGAMYEFYIPQELAYGKMVKSNIPPYSALIFKVELMKPID